MWMTCSFWQQLTHDQMLTNKFDMKDLDIMDFKTF
jgi:hypothetical protein